MFEYFEDNKETIEKVFSIMIIVVLSVFALVFILTTGSEYKWIKVALGFLAVFCLVFCVIKFTSLWELTSIRVIYYLVLNVSLIVPLVLMFLYSTDVAMKISYFVLFGVGAVREIVLFTRRFILHGLDYAAESIFNDCDDIID